MRRRRRASLIGVLLAVLLGGGYLAKNYQGLPLFNQPAASSRVVRVYDGDTVALGSGERVRLIGIDTPESRDNSKLRRDAARRRSRKEAQLAMGKAAGKYVEQLLNGEDVRLEFDVQQRDRYGRLLAYVYLPDGTFVNKKIICDGYAYPLTIPPNVRHAHEFKACFDEARAQRRGLWQ